MHTRRLLINKVNNMRDLGGYATADGYTTQWNRFIRSNIPLGLTDADTRLLYDYGIRTVIDLRHPEEVAMQPTILAQRNEFCYHNIPFTDDFSLLGDTQYCPLHHLVPVVQGPTRIKSILRMLAHCEGGALFYCFAGKDRTGVIAALLLMLARVPMEDIIADYQVTYTYIRNLFTMRQNDVGNRPLFLLEMDKDKPPRPEHLRRTEPEWIQPFIDYVVSFGGAEGYLDYLGLEPCEIFALRNRLVN